MSQQGASPSDGMYKEFDRETQNVLEKAEMAGIATEGVAELLGKIPREIIEAYPPNAVISAAVSYTTDFDDATISQITGNVDENTVYEVRKRIAEETEISYPDFDQDGKVVCKECGKSFIRLSTHLTETHEMPREEYYDEHGEDSPLRAKDKLEAAAEGPVVEESLQDVMSESHAMPGLLAVDIDSLTVAEIKQYVQLLNEHVEKYAERKEEVQKYLHGAADDL